MEINGREENLDSESLVGKKKTAYPQEFKD